MSESKENLNNTYVSKEVFNLHSGNVEKELFQTNSNINKIFTILDEIRTTLAETSSSTKGQEKRYDKADEQMTSFAEAMQGVTNQLASISEKQETLDKKLDRELEKVDAEFKLISEHISKVNKYIGLGEKLPVIFKFVVGGIMLCLAVLGAMDLVVKVTNK